MLQPIVSLEGSALHRWLLPSGAIVQENGGCTEGGGPTGAAVILEDGAALSLLGGPIAERAPWLVTLGAEVVGGDEAADEAFELPAGVHEFFHALSGAHYVTRIEAVDERSHRVWRSDWNAFAPAMGEGARFLVYARGGRAGPRDGCGPLDCAEAIASSIALVNLETGETKTLGATDEPPRYRVHGALVVTRVRSKRGYAYLAIDTRSARVRPATADELWEGVAADGLSWQAGPSFRGRSPPSLASFDGAGRFPFVLRVGRGEEPARAGQCDLPALVIAPNLLFVDQGVFTWPRQAP